MMLLGVNIKIDIVTLD